MAHHPGAGNYDVAQIAGQILNASLSEQKTRLCSKLVQARRIIPDIHPHDTLEQERLEVLKGAVEWLESPVMSQAQAAMHVLEQLANSGGQANQTPKSSSIKARRAPVLTICPVKPAVPFRVHTALRSTG